MDNVRQKKTSRFVVLTTVKPTAKIVVFRKVCSKRNINVL